MNIHGRSREEKMRAILLPVIKPELVENFFEIWTDWFVTQDTIEDEKFPGKMKGIIINY